MDVLVWKDGSADDQVVNAESNKVFAIVVPFTTSVDHYPLDVGIVSSCFGILVASF